MKRIAWIVLMVFVLVVPIFACKGGGNPTGPSEYESLIVGTWKLSVSKKITETYRSDYTCEINGVTPPPNVKYDPSCNWKIEGNTLIVRGPTMHMIRTIESITQEKMGLRNTDSVGHLLIYRKVLV
ncbi:MAG: hypothetical protein AAB411_02295 [Patescibacteria group bacterium]